MRGIAKFILGCAAALSFSAAHAATHAYTGVFTAGALDGCCYGAPPPGATLSLDLTVVGAPYQLGSIVGFTAKTGSPSAQFSGLDAVYYGDGVDVVVSSSTHNDYWLVTEYNVWCFYCEVGPPSDTIYGVSATLYSGPEPVIYPGCGGLCGATGPEIETGFVGKAPTGVPEPADWALWVAGLGGLGAALRTRRHFSVTTART